MSDIKPERRVVIDVRIAVLVDGTVDVGCSEGGMEIGRVSPWAETHRSFAQLAFHRGVNMLSVSGVNGLGHFVCV